MIKKFLSFYTTFMIGLFLATFYADMTQPRQNVTNSPKSCKFEESSEVFSQKHYFSASEIDGLLGKKVKNLKCGKIKCPIGFDTCSSVEIGETGKVIGLQPRDGLPGYLIVIGWDNKSENFRFTTAEQNPYRFVSYVGNNGSFEFID